MIQSLNEVSVSGILSEIDLRTGEKDGKKYIAGKITLQVEQNVSGNCELEEIQVNGFAYNVTKSGSKNPGYDQLNEILTKGVSLAACGDPAKADRISIGGGSMSLNRYVGKDGTLKTFPQIRGSFFNKVTHNFVPKAIFDSEIFIKDITDEMSKSGELTGRLTVTGILVQYNGTPDIINYVVEDPSAIEYIRNNWNPEDTVRISGFIRSTVIQENVASNTEFGFGEAPEKTFERTVRDFVITSGSSGSIDPDKCNSTEDILVALTEQKALDDEKLAEGNKSTSASAVNKLRGF